ncbi:MAG: BON domain-containing protein [Bryobacteraceae bacterium]
MLRFLLLLTIAIGAMAQAPPATDAQIEAQIHDRLAKSVVGKDGFTAKVKGGVVYWEGSTAIAQHKGAATRMAKSSGARRVVNNIKVKKASPSAPRPTASVAPAASPSPVAPAPAPAAASPPLNRVAVKWR